MPALLLLLHRRRVGPDLSPRAWCPFRLQFYCNGHSWPARQLTAAGVGFTLADNAFLRIDDWQRAQALADTRQADAAGLSEGLRQAQQERCRRCGRICVAVTAALDAVRAGKGYRAIRVDAAMSEVIMSFLAGDRLGECSELRLREMGTSSFAGGCSGSSVIAYFRSPEPCLVDMEARATAHYRAVS
jgi:hypothetical protein